jgi:hypothetical protein
MGALGVAALIVIFILLVGITAVIVVLGSLPGNIAKERGHPYAEAVNVASWMGIFTGIMWPFVLIWAYVPASGGTIDQPATTPDPAPEVED